MNEEQILIKAHFDRKLFIRYIVRETLGLVVMDTALFWSARTFNWWPAWTLTAVTLAWIIGTAVVIVTYHPEMLAERLGPRKGAKLWDTVIMSLLGAAQLARYIVAGLDYRHGWTGNFSIVVIIAGILLCIFGYALFVWSAAANAFFSQIVRIQTERGQTVVTRGPYHSIRHPAYLGAILVELGVPILLSSWWALSITVLTLFLLLLRTFLEDQTLQKELPGYQEYSTKVRYRLLPGIW
jgi:protein-S-isoprenylcysteine O-methyltransferase Ste14